jgi:hypothetical protein
MKLKQFVAMFIFVFAFRLPAFASQEAIGVDYFEVKGTKTYTCWGDNKADIYRGDPATFTVGSCGNTVPVDMNVGKGSLMFQTTIPHTAGGPWGYWNIMFRIKDWPTVNFMRYGLNGQKPYLYLRVRWAQIAPGAGLEIRLKDNHEIWNLYANYAGQNGTYSDNYAAVQLSTYVPNPVVGQWYDVYIPIQDFLNNNPNLDLTRILSIIFLGTGTYSQTNTFYIEKIKVVPATGSNNQYLDMVKVNQLGYLTNERKLAIVSYEPNAVTSAPTQFQVINSSTQAVVYTGTLVLKNPSSPDWNQSGDIVYQANFSSFTAPGRYKIILPEIAGQSSVEF